MDVVDEDELSSVVVGNIRDSARYAMPCHHYVIQQKYYSEIQVSCSDLIHASLFYTLFTFILKERIFVKKR